jgi:anti-sigma factor RsiW
MTSRRDAERRAHDAYRLLVAATVDGSIDPDDAVALEAHLETCGACLADRRAMMKTIVGSRRLEAPPFPTR